ncbi:MAG: outer membrane beta-barrel protein [Ignavibacteriaceae bacterium]
MKRFILTFFCSALFILFANTSQAQMLKLGVSAGLTSLTSPAGYTNSVGVDGLGFGSNFNFGLQVRIDVPLIPLTPIVFVNYHMLRGSGNVNNIAVSTSQNIWSAGVEAEYNILPLPFVKPYVSIEAAINSFGSLSADFSSFNLSQGGMTRYGSAIGIGTVVTILPIVDLDASLKYNLFNLIGKSSGESSINALTLDLAVIF